jgi:hypothetical protein
VITILQADAAGQEIAAWIAKEKLWTAPAILEALSCRHD